MDMTLLHSNLLNVEKIEININHKFPRGAPKFQKFINVSVLEYCLDFGKFFFLRC